MVSTRVRLSAAADMVFALALVIPSNAQKVALADGEKSEILIVGMGAKAGAVLFQSIPGSWNTIVIRVDSVIEKPKAAVLSAGDNTTLVSSEVSSLRPRIHGAFYTGGLVARELPEGPGDTPEPSKKKDEAVQARKVAGDSELRRQIQAADLVIVGTVKDVRAATIPMAAPKSTAVKEHDPLWQEAAIHSDYIIKGLTNYKDFIVHFPASVDVAWYKAPKLKPGQEGVFLLKQDAVSGAPTVMFQNKKVQAYTVLNPVDVLGKEETQRVRSLAAK